MDVCTWQDNQPVSIISSIPDEDRFEDPENKCTILRLLRVCLSVFNSVMAFVSTWCFRKVKDSKGQWSTITVFRPRVVALFEKYMGGADLLWVFSPEVLSSSLSSSSLSSSSSSSSSSYVSHHHHYLQQRSPTSTSHPVPSIIDIGGCVAAMYPGAVPIISNFWIKLF